MQFKLAIITTHPIQYYAPVFKKLAQHCQLKVFYTWGEKSIESKFDPGFGKTISWDIPLLEGYSFEFLKNTSKQPGSHHYNGIVNPGAINRIKEFNPHAVLVYGWAYKSHLNIIRYFKGRLPVWFRGDSNLIDQNKGWKQIARHIFLRWVYSNVDKAFYVGSANKEYYLKYGLKEEQLIFAPHAVENERFSIDRSFEAQLLRKQLGVGVETILILFAGKLEPKKNPELLLAAFLELDKPNVHLLFIGSGVLENKLKKQSKNLSTIHFLPFQNQQRMPVMYQACDLFCLPSKGRGETWGLAVNEAMAAGKAILVSNRVGCAPDLVKDGINGFIFNYGEINDVKTKLEKLMDKSVLNEMGKKSLDIIAGMSISTQVKAILSCFI